MKKILLIVSIFFSLKSFSQNISAYTDNRGYFYEFDNGEFRQVEYMPVKSYRAGGQVIGYIDNTNEFNFYYNGQKYHQCYASDDMSYYVTDYLAACKIGKVLIAFEKGKSQKLCYYSSSSVVADSLIAYLDETNANFNVYYKGENISIESSMLESPRNVKAGSNTLVYVNQSNYFKVFYRGETQDLSTTAPESFEAGRDLVAYVDGYDKNFHLFYKGQNAKVETFPPLSYKVGFGVLAYIDNEENFRIFSEGATRRLLPNRPDFFDVKGNMIVYANNNQFNAFYRGKMITIDDVIPQNYQLGNDGVAWIDASNRLKLFLNGQSYTASYETVNKYVLNNNVLTYQVGVNTWKVFFNGTTY